MVRLQPDEAIYLKLIVKRPGERPAGRACPGGLIQHLALMLPEQTVSHLSCPPPTHNHLATGLDTDSTAISELDLDYSRRYPGGLVVGAGTAAPLLCWGGISRCPCWAAGERGRHVAPAAAASSQLAYVASLAPLRCGHP